jgi:hypothetical protein
MAHTQYMEREMNEASERLAQEAKRTKRTKRNNASWGITINERVSRPDELPALLERLAGLIREGYTYGYEPEWSVEHYGS